jgi:hypothetical protein
MCSRRQAPRRRDRVRRCAADAAMMQRRPLAQRRFASLRRGQLPIIRSNSTADMHLCAASIVEECRP